MREKPHPRQWRGWDRYFSAAAVIPRESVVPGISDDGFVAAENNTSKAIPNCSKAFSSTDPRSPTPAFGGSGFVSQSSRPSLFSAAASIMVGRHQLHLAGVGVGVNFRDSMLGEGPSGLNRDQMRGKAHPR